MTKANDNANAERKRLEKNARAKLRRLQKSGVSVGNLSPIQPVDTSDTRAVKRYNQQLRNFNSRDNSLVAGYSGQAVSAKLWKEYQRIEKLWNQEHRRYWSKWREKPLYSAGVEQAMSAELYQRMRGTRGTANPEYQRSANLASIKGNKDLQRRIERLSRELTPEYRQRRAEAFVKNISDKIESFGDDELTQLFERLTVEQAERLQRQTLFQTNFFELYKSKDSDAAAMVDAMKEDIRAILATEETEQKKKAKKPRKRKR